MSILKREIFFDYTGGLARFWDWAICTTTLGTMAEPFAPNDRHRMNGISEFDPTDEIARIDDIRAASVDKQAIQLSGGQHALIGGYQMPRNSQR